MTCQANQSTVIHDLRPFEHIIYILWKLVVATFLCMLYSTKCIKLSCVHIEAVLNQFPVPNSYLVSYEKISWMLPQRGSNQGPSCYSGDFLSTMPLQFLFSTVMFAINDSWIALNIFLSFIMIKYTYRQVVCRWKLSNLNDCVNRREYMLKIQSPLDSVVFIMSV